MTWPDTRPAAPAEPRVEPGRLRDIGVINTLITRVIGVATGGRPPNVFTTLARHRSLFRRWLIFASGLMPGGRLSRRETELVILDVARRMDCPYEWDHHEVLGRKAGISDDALAAVRDGDIDAPVFTARERALLLASRELHEHRVLGASSWATLRSALSEVECIEVCMLVGHYQMLAMTLASLQVQRDP